VKGDSDRAFLGKTGLSETGRGEDMDLFVATAYGIVSAYVGFVIGVFVYGSHVERRPPGGGETPPASPEDPGPEDWALWEDEFTPATAS
jgi:hypothetical protein